MEKDNAETLSAQSKRGENPERERDLAWLGMTKLWRCGRVVKVRIGKKEQRDKPAATFGTNLGRSIGVGCEKHMRAKGYLRGRGTYE
jgi:hypothetical protein